MCELEVCILLKFRKKNDAISRLCFWITTTASRDAVENNITVFRFDLTNSKLRIFFCNDVAEKFQFLTSAQHQSRSETTLGFRRTSFLVGLWQVCLSSGQIGSIGNPISKRCIHHITIYIYAYYLMITPAKSRKSPSNVRSRSNKFRKTIFRSLASEDRFVTVLPFSLSRYCESASRMNTQAYKRRHSDRRKAK